VWSQAGEGNIYSSGGAVEHIWENWPGFGGRLLILFYSSNCVRDRLGVVLAKGSVRDAFIRVEYIKYKNKIKEPNHIQKSNLRLSIKLYLNDQIEHEILL
jgi:hypothetical protein